MDGYDDTRQRRALIVGAVLAAAVLLAVGFGAGRASAPTAGPASGAASAGQAGPGPTHVVNGVPVGYAHTQAGAVAAATNFVIVQTGPLISQPDRYRAAIDTIATPEARGALRSVAEKSLAAFADTILANAQQGRAVMFKSVPLAYHLQSYDGRMAHVTIWSESFIGVDGSIGLTESWSTATYPVEWVAGDWKLAGEGVGSAGPVPQIAQPSGLDLKLPPQAKDYRSYGYGPGQ